MEERSRNFRLDVRGKRFGRWRVLHKLPKKAENGSTLWECECDCGNRSFVPLGNLRSGMSKGCIECGRKNLHKITHGQSRNPTQAYTSWCRAKNNGKHPRGWKTFEEFLEVMGDCPEGETLIKKDPYRAWSTRNAMWGTSKQRKRRSRKPKIRVLNFNLSQADWARKLGVSRQFIAHVINRTGCLEGYMKERAKRNSITVRKLIENFSDFK